jgi:hypothetical protein
MVARLALASHTLTIERLRAGDFSQLAAGGSVLPEEAIRFSAHFGWQFSPASIQFSILDAQDQVVWGPSQINVNLAGNGWEDVQAPLQPGNYTLLGVATEGFPGTFGRVTSSHPMTRTFRVDASAPPPPGGGFQLPDFGDLFKSPWTFVVILGALIALGILL